MGPGLPDTSFFGPMVTIALVFIAAVAVLIVVAIVRNARAARRRGHDPMTMQTELASRLLESDALRGSGDATERLAKLEQLKAAGTISDAEYAAARQRIIGEV
jgi:uncharacterized membrane protein